MNKFKFNKYSAAFNLNRRRAVLASVLGPLMTVPSIKVKSESLPNVIKTIPGGGRESSLADYLGYDSKRYRSAAAKVEDGRIGIASGDISGTYLIFVDDLKTITYSEKENGRVRVVPMLNNGSVQTMSDLLNLKATDAGIVQGDVMQDVRKLNAEGHVEARGMLKHLRYVTKLYDEEVHLLARGGYTSIEQLSNTIINVGSVGSGTQFTAERVLKKYAPAIQKKTYYSPERALDELSNGRIDAMFLVVGKPTALLPKLARVWKEKRLGFLAVEGDIGPEYSSAWLDKRSYPFLDKRVKTISVPSVLAAYNHTNVIRKRNLERFCNAFVDNLAELRDHAGENKLYHPKWNEFFENKNLTANVPSWTRLEEMERILK